MIAALFDLDGTLYTGHIWQDLARHHMAARRHRRWVAAYLIWNMAPLPLYKLGLMSRTTYFQTWGETMSWLLRGWPLAEAQALFEELTEEQVVPNVRLDMLARLHHHRDQGHSVALVSGTFVPFLEVIARRLDVQHAIGTPLEVRGGRYTGRIVPPLCQGEGKPQRATAYFADQNIEIDWPSSYAYADRDSDIPLLSMVGQPAAVYPDEILLAYARSQDWPVIGEVNS
jgi:putative phosphoserine phosphatase/1-acylglycerol-3-phosphate O-acyltransferase